MNKAQLATRIAADTGLTKLQAAAAVNSFIAGVIHTLKAGKRVTLVGFGTFSVVKRAARKGRNPATGETVKIKSKKVGKFKASKELNTRL